MKSEINLKKILFISIFTLLCITINYLGAKGAAVANFPLYLDSLLTICVVALCGLIPGLICAVSTNMLMVILMGSSPLYTFCHLTTALIAWLLFIRCKKTDPGKDLTIDVFLWAGFFAAISNAILGNIITDKVYGALTGLPQADTVAQAFFTAVNDRILCIYISGFIQNLTDKIISTVISFIIYKKIRDSMFLH